MKKNKRIINIVPLIILTVGLLSLTTFAKTYYAASQKKISSSVEKGTKTEPWIDLKSCIKNLMPGDTLILLPGTYERPVTINISGTESKPIVVRAEKRNTVFFVGAKIIKLIDIEKKDSLYRYNVSNVLLNFERIFISNTNYDSVISLYKINSDKNLNSNKNFVTNNEYVNFKFEGPNIEDYFLYIPETTTLLKVVGNYIEVSNLNFIFSTGYNAGISFEGNNCVLNNCKVEYMNFEGIRIFKQSNTITNSVFSYCG